MINWTYKAGDKVVLKADEDEGWERQNATVIGPDGDDEELYVVEVEPEDEDDDGIRGSIDLSQIEGH